MPGRVAGDAMITTRESFDAWASARRAAHDSSAEHTQKSIRHRVRARALELGVDCPAWTTRLSLSERALRGWASRQNKTEPARNQRIVPPTFKNPRPRPVAPAAPVCTPVSIPPELSAWRAAGEGRAVHCCQTGVVLTPGIGLPLLRFPSVDAALAAIVDS